MKNKELRFINETLTTNENEGEIFGRAIVFNSEAPIGDKFIEVIEPSALKKTLSESKNIPLFFNHNNNFLLASTSTGNLKLEERDDGLYFSSNIINTSYGEDVKKLVRAGELKGVSFSFSVVKEEWKKKNNEVYRNVKELRLYEISLVQSPAYKDTFANIRNYLRNVNYADDEINEIFEKPNYVEYYKKMLQIM